MADVPGVLGKALISFHAEQDEKVPREPHRRHDKTAREADREEQACGSDAHRGEGRFQGRGDVRRHKVLHVAAKFGHLLHQR